MMQIEPLTPMDIEKMQKSLHNDKVAVIFVVIAFLLIFWGIYSQGYISTPIFAFGIVISLSVSGIFVFKQKQVQTDIQEHHKEVYVGPVDKERVKQGVRNEMGRKGGETLYYLLLDGVRFQVGKSTYRSVRRGDVYKIARAVNSKYVLLVEKQ